MSKSKKNEEQLVEIENLIALLPKAVKDTSGRNLEIRTQERKTNGLSISSVGQIASRFVQSSEFRLVNGMGLRGIERVTEIYHTTIMTWIKAAGMELPYSRGRGGNTGNNGDRGVTNAECTPPQAPEVNSGERGSLCRFKEK